MNDLAVAVSDMVQSNADVCVAGIGSKLNCLSIKDLAKSADSGDILEVKCTKTTESVASEVRLSELPLEHTTFFVALIVLRHILLCLCCCCCS